MHPAMIEIQTAANRTVPSTGPPVLMGEGCAPTSSAIAAGISIPTKAKQARDNEILGHYKSRVQQPLIA